MGKISTMSNVSVTMDSTVGPPVTITAIAKANPAIVSAAGHGFSNGDFIFIETEGMYQLDEKIYRVAAQSSGSLQLEDVTGGVGIDAVDFDTFSSGTAKKVTFGKSITTATTISSSGGEFDSLDTTVIHRNVKSEIPGSASQIIKEFDNLWDVSDEGQIEMKRATVRNQIRMFKFVYGVGGAIEVFAGRVAFLGSANGAAQQVITSPAKITSIGFPTYYSS